MTDRRATGARETDSGTVGDNGRLGSYRLSRINMPAMMPSKAKPVVTVEVSLMLRNGKSPVRINHRPSKSIPRFLPAKLLVSAISFSFVIHRLHR